MYASVSICINVLYVLDTTKNAGHMYYEYKSIHYYINIYKNSLGTFYMYEPAQRLQKIIGCVIKPKVVREKTPKKNPN